MDEITAEYAPNQLIEAPQLRCRVHASFGAKTDLGRVRENNEDKYEFYIPTDEAQLATRGQVFIVCDGMGGHAAGQIASELSCKVFIDVYLHHPSADARAAAKAAAEAANRFVVDVSRTVPTYRGMGTTLSALMLVQDRAILAQVGDSRIYRLRDGAISMLTTDHTWVEDVVSQGIMAREEAEVHQYRHVLTRAIGTEDTVLVDTFDFDLRVGDTFLLCSDGVTNHVSDPELESFMGLASPSEAAWKTILAALAGGGSDNATVIVVKVDEIEAVER